MTVLDVRKLLDRAGFHYFLSPDREAVMVGVAGLNGRYQFVVNLQADGNFLQFRSVGFLSCAASSPCLTTVLKAMADINYSIRGVKMGWDEHDGELVLYADLWVLDGAVTDRQFGQTMFGFMQVLDVAFVRFSRILATGKDPGNESPEQILKKLLAGGAPEGHPPDVAELLKKAVAGKGAAPRDTPKRDGPGDDFSEI